jgi:cell division protein FtsB
MTRLTPLKLWTALFALWGLLLSGILASFVGSPGIIQALRLKSLLASKQAQIERMQNELIKLQNDAVQLDHGKVAQQREIRRVLGYAAADEIVFDFTHSPDP